MVTMVRMAQISQIDGLLDESSGPNVHWTTVNTAEAMPGVMTPLGWTFWGPALEVAMRGSFVDFGVLEPRELRYPAMPDQRFTAIFRGRVAANVDLLREVVGNRMPGTSASALELQLLGAVRDGVADHPTKRRYGPVALRLPTAATLLPRRLRALRTETDAWWRATVFGPEPDPDHARALLADALARFTVIMRRHSFASFVCQGAYDQVAQFAARAGSPGAETRLVTGYGGMEETAIAADLWEVSRGGLTREDFIRRHGYHGPGEGEISSRVWREDPGPLEAAIARYRGMSDDLHPLRVEAGRVQARKQAEQELLAASSPRRRAADRAVLAAARRYIPLREVGKAAFLQTIDVARFAVRHLGTDLQSVGVVDDVEDVFLLTVDELRSGPTGDQRAVVAARAAQRQEFLRTGLPDSWTGRPEPVGAVDASETASDELVLRAVAASAGVPEGRARSVHHPAEADIAEGEVVVCETTDPSWTLIFVTAGAMVIDIGGPISHGAIVAREMGIPCVINTRTGTRTIRDGDLVRVDGGAGTVEILSRTESPSGESR